MYMRLLRATAWVAFTAVVSVAMIIVVMLYAEKQGRPLKVTISEQSLQNLNLGNFKLNASSGKIYINFENVVVRLELNDVQIFDEGAKLNDAALLTVPTLITDIDIFTFLLGEIEISSINLTNLEWTVPLERLPSSFANSEGGDLLTDQISILSFIPKQNSDILKVLSNISSFYLGNSVINFLLPDEHFFSVNFNVRGSRYNKNSNLILEGDGILSRKYIGSNPKQIAGINFQGIHDDNFLRSANLNLNIDSLTVDDIRTILPVTLSQKFKGNADFAGSFNFALEESSNTTIDWDIDFENVNFTGSGKVAENNSDYTLLSNFSGDGLAPFSRGIINQISKSFVSDIDFTDDFDIDFAINLDSSLSIKDLKSSFNIEGVNFNSPYFASANSFDDLAGVLDFNMANASYKLSDLKVGTNGGRVLIDLDYFPNKEDIILDLAVENLPARTVISLIPIDAMPTIRPWIAENIHIGLVERGNVSYRNEAKKVTNIEVEFDFSSAEISYYSSLPPVINGAGNLRFSEDVINISMEKGGINARETALNYQSPDYKYLSLRKDSNIKINVNRNAPDQLISDFSLQGDVKAIVDFLDYPELSLLAAKGISFKNLKGQGNYHILYSQEIGTNNFKDTVKVEFSSDLKGVSYSGGPLGIGISDGEGLITFNTESEKLNILGSAISEGVIFDINWRQSKNQQNLLDRNIVLKPKVNRSLANVFKIPTLKSLDGYFTVVADIKDISPREAVISAKIDATDLEIKNSLFALDKPLGEKATANLSGTLVDAVIAIESAKLISDSLAVDINGEANLNTGEVIDMTFLAKGIGLNKNVTLNFSAEESVKNINVAADVLDASDIFSAEGLSDILSEPKDGSAKTTQNQKDTRLILKADNFYLSKGQLLDNLDVDVSFKGNRMIANSYVLIGKKDFELRAVLSQKNQSESGNSIKPWNISINNLGNFMNNSFGLGALEGGQLYAEIEGAGKNWQSFVKVVDAEITDSPAFISFLDKLSISGLLTSIATKNIKIKNAKGNLSIDKDKLYVDKLWVYTDSSLYSLHGDMALADKTLDFEGTFSPGYLLTSTIGRLPVIRHLFSDPDSNTILSSNFFVLGSLDNIDIKINPISLLAPGIIKRLADLNEEAEKGAENDNEQSVEK